MPERCVKVLGLQDKSVPCLKYSLVEGEQLKENFNVFKGVTFARKF